MLSSLSAKPSRFIAIDWSGAASIAGQRRHIVAAHYEAGDIILSGGRTRAETIAWLIEQARRTPALMVGLDFAFSYPAWFVKQHASKVEDFWSTVEKEGEFWLASCDAPFWGRPGRQCPPNHRATNWLGYRQADRLPQGMQPKSPFQVGGAGTVGTGSLRGIPSLLALRNAGFSIWPFHATSFPMVMEIYPRAFTGPVRKSSREARAEFLSRHCREAGDAAINIATESEDAFDALCSVIGMARQSNEIARLQPATNISERLEGAIFSAKPIQSE
jgi:hypothetical protein